MEDKDSFAAALKRAREIAAKMQVNVKSSEGQSGSKGDSDPDSFESKKKLALEIANTLSRRIPKEIRVMNQGLNRDGELMIHMMIPSVVVCLFAGKDNETLVWMRDRTGTKMDMNLEHPYANPNEKPLTIIGEPDKVEAARELVNQYIREKDELLGINANNMQVSLGIEYSELLIPKEAVGLVIGKQGENIKKVNNETGCVVKFRPLGPRDDERFRICTFHGTATQIKKAREQISELVEYLKQKFGLARPVPKPGQEFAEVRVSAAKAGIVIGRGGETIKQINNLSGASVCIDRSVAENSEYRTFFVVGTHEQVEHAKYLIREKSGEACDLPFGAIAAMSPNYAGVDPFADQPPMPPMFASPMAMFACDPTYGLQPPWFASPSPYPQPPMQQPAPQQPPSYPQESAPPQDYSAAWASYYQQYYAYIQQQQGQEGASAPPQEGVATNTETPNADQMAYWNSYYQQLYAQNPELYQQYMAAYAQQMADSNAQNTPATYNQQQKQTEVPPHTISSPCVPVGVSRDTSHVINNNDNRPHSEQESTNEIPVFEQPHSTQQIETKSFSSQKSQEHEEKFLSCDQIVDTINYSVSEKPNDKESLIQSIEVDSDDSEANNLNSSQVHGEESTAVYHSPEADSHSIEQLQSEESTPSQPQEVVKRLTKVTKSKTKGAPKKRGRKSKQ